MALFVDAARAAFNSSYATNSDKRPRPRFWPPFCDWEPVFLVSVTISLQFF